MYADRILEIISPMTIFAASILGRHCRALGKTPQEISRDDLHYLAISIERSVALFAGAESGRVAGQQILKLRGSDPSIHPQTLRS